MTCDLKSQLSNTPDIYSKQIHELVNKSTTLRKQLRLPYFQSKEILLVALFSSM
jgi:hypothetical protein